MTHAAPPFRGVGRFAAVPPSLDSRSRAGAPSLWPGAMHLITLIAATTLMLAQTHVFGGDPVVDAGRWLMLGLMAAMILIRPSSLMRLRRPHLLDGFVAAFLVLAFASILYSTAPSITLQRSLSLVLLYVGVFWSLWFLADVIGGERISDALLMLAGMFFIAGVASFFLTEDTWLKGRYRGILENPNAIGMMAVLFVPPAMARFIRKRSLASASLIALLLGSLAFSGSRNGVLTVCLGIVFMMWRIRAWRTGLFFAAVFSIAFLAMPDGNVATGRAATPLSRLVASDKLATAGGRIEAWEVAIPIIQQKILMGHGFGTEDLIFQDMKFRIHRGLYIHNSYLGITYQLGVVGAVVLFLPLIGLLVTRIVRTSRPPPQIAAYEAVLFGALIASLFESWIYSAGNAFGLPFWAMMMLLVRASQFDRVERERGGRVEPARAAVRMRPALAAVSPAALSSGRQVRRYDPPVKR